MSTAVTDAQASLRPPIRWGVLGANSAIAQRSTLPAIATSPFAIVTAVASKSHPDGAGYDTHGALRTYATYDEVVGDDEVEAVYIALPNGMHSEWTVRAAEAGKHVLCEKPLATASAEALEMVQACEQNGVVLMEALATPFHPRAVLLQELLRSRRLGMLRSAYASFTRVLEVTDDMHWRPEAGGGALLDMGVDCLALLLQSAGHPPIEVAGAGMLARTGVDASFQGFLDFGKAFTAGFACSLETAQGQVLEIAGKQATVSIERPFTPSATDTSLRLVNKDGTVEDIEAPAGDAHQVMVEHFAEVVRDATPLRCPPAKSIEVLKLVERLKSAARWEF